MTTAEARLWREEYEALSQRWEALSARLRTEEDSALLRQRLRRVEALMGALTGNAEALSQ